MCISYLCKQSILCFFSFVIWKITVDTVWNFIYNKNLKIQKKKNKLYVFQEILRKIDIAMTWMTCKITIFYIRPAKVNGINFVIACNIPIYFVNWLYKWQWKPSKKPHLHDFGLHNRHLNRYQMIHEKKTSERSANHCCECQPIHLFIFFCKVWIVFCLEASWSRTITLTATKKRLIKERKKKSRNCIKNEWIIMKWAHRNRRAWPVVWVQRAYMRLYYTSLTLCSFYFDLFFHNAVNWSHSQCYLRSMHHRDLRFCYDCCFCGPFFSIEK